MSYLLTSASPFSSCDRSSPNGIKKLHAPRKIATNNQKSEQWSLDHTSRAPSGRQSISESLNVNKIEYSLLLHKEQLSSYLKYYNSLHEQLQENLHIAIKKLEIKKTEILTKIEYNYLACVNEARLREKEKSFALCKHIKELGIALKNNEQAINKISNNFYIEEQEIDELLNPKWPKKMFDENWIEICINDLELFERGNDVLKETKSVDSKYKNDRYRAKSNNCSYKKLENRDKNMREIKVLNPYLEYQVQCREQSRSFLSDYE
ncbi:hypothetical protein SteCoe_18943 [Stentor coeruleus]|uniref:Uncharacterized protein n=1 Tax=Stentor coeruleus TaxID=5963 RepID=A0A1R2BVH5_9CILI|nr:hypothetical protein SteCoe_18943 [Stentor coeruleus]